jgi:hypothetical protein
MRCFIEVVTVKVDAAAIARARQFATAVTPTVGNAGQGYEDTKQRNLAKVQLDHFVSKVGEEAVKIVFEQLGKPVQGPDYQIYQGRKKSWESDLYVAGVGLAVKTQTTESARRFGLSWTFQAGDQRRDPILNQPEAWVCFVEFDPKLQQCRVYPPYQIRELLFAEPKLDKFKGNKQVVYAQSLAILAVPLREGLD